MWEMLDPDLECGNECGGPGPPPEFLVPPPPRPPFLAELVNCNEEQLLLQQTTAPFGGGAGGAAGSFAEVDMCEAFPIIDASYHSGPSFQTSAMIVLCSGLLLLVIFISSLLVWKHKRKVQNFLPCKTPTRGPPHLDATGVPTGHSVTYEDPDVHLGHHPLVMRHHHHHHHHHNMELHAKQIHYPSGYPMPRSPPLFICSSPGPDPYRSHDNVYEELEHGPGRDTDSEPPIQSDDDFAEDELSLPGDRSFHKSPSDGGTTVATIYHDRSNGGGSSNSAVTTASASTMPVTDGGGGGGGCCAAGVEGSVGGPPAPATAAGSGPSSAYLERNRTERNSLLSSSSSSGNDNTHPLAHHHHHHRGGTAAVPPSSSAGGLNGAGNSNNNNNNGSSGGGNSSGSSSASNSNRNSNSSTDCGNNNNSNNNNNNNNSNSSGSSSLPNGTGGTTHCNGVGGVLGLFRSRKHHPAATLGSSGRRQAAPAFNSCSLDGGPLGEPVVLPPMYDDRGMMTLPPPAYAHTLTTTTTGTGGHHHHHPLHHHPHHHHLNSVNNNSLGNQHHHRSNYYSTIDDDGGGPASEPLDPVERRNRINAQLSASAGGVSTIFRNGHRTPGTTVGAPIGGYGSGRSRTNPRRHGRNGNSGSQQQQPLAVISAPSQDPSQYIYHEPVFHEGLIYDGCLSHTYSDRSGGSGSTGTGSTGGGVAYHHPYILPQFTTFRNGGGGGVGGGSVAGVPPSSHPAGTNGGHSIYSRDSSFGSDSGYSQHTQTSNRSVAGWSHRRPAGGQSGTGTVANPKVAATATEQQQQQQPPQSTMVVDS
uniref:uncharacterized protein DDB_G0283357 n=1 Tax=Anopheles coluzzii TaxID=1518534 RepID=UPI0020FFD1B1|nr:uncharacterized protein DDB_G0283357 [Anopheles coluzzii]XP_040219407.2 uncharacterized protein DDB_G0283357 [Anopheles coluzzii]XP_040219408.2 uncharacterized protein DDB_G0283357 [Anopheles coluzzii]XP_049463700.1 uncharacterized protein DDB_G0283357 [Anopheles coluzzii]XP_049463701.1 uncharacterized protein DDB_G0283357 [Anopheles coluzzii]XP_049463702.1 uncharacterized protein DDB_G0283357 [Anopheles coluzzii]